MKQEFGELTESHRLFSKLFQNLQIRTSSEVENFSIGFFYEILSPRLWLRRLEASWETTVGREGSLLLRTSVTSST